MQSPFVAKEVAQADTPVFLFECTLSDSTVQRWSSQTIQISGNTYAGRVLKHNLFEAQVASDTQIGGSPRLSFELANADSHFSEIEQQTGFKGARLVVSSVFVDTSTGQATTDAIVVFRGLVNPPDQITENTFRLSAMNRMSMQRTQLPEVSVQRLCPWRFPATADQRANAADGSAENKYSFFYRCGYSPDQAGGVGNLNAGAPFTSCALTRSDCTQRGMFAADSAARQTARFGGLEYVPASILVRGAGQKSLQVSNVQENQALYNDPVPLIYGTQWHRAAVVFSRNDGNLTRMEVLLCMGEIEGVLTVLVDDAVIPQGVSGQNMTSTGWWNLISAGARNGAQDPNFGDGGAGPSGDPYGSMAYLSVVVPNRINDGSSIPAVQVLVRGMKLLMFDTDGNALGEEFSANPAWVLLDILRRSAYGLDEIDTKSFALAAAYCDEAISVNDPIIGPVSVPRLECNFALASQRSAGEIIRALRNSSRIYIVLNTSGLLEARIENTFALQQATLPAGSNATEMFAGGWPAYEFAESSIARNPDGSANFRITARGAQDTPNRLTVEFQDEFNQYQQDSLSLTDGDDSDLCGQIIAAQWDAMGISNFSQASRMLLLGLNRGVQGNQFVEFETSVKALGLMPGDLITVTYLKENLQRTAFRVQKIRPGASFRTAIITAQLHNDLWYSDTVSSIIGGRGWQAGQRGGLPAPVAGTILDSNGILQLGITEAEVAGSDNSTNLELTVAFTAPSGQGGALPGPLVDLSAAVSSSGGTLAGGVTWFYALSAVDATGGESSLSFIAQASTAAGGNTNSVTLSGIGMPLSAVSFHVYRGPGPEQLFRIASSVAPAASFTDTGLAPQAILPPDPQFDHVELSWRWELLPEAPVTVHSATTIGNGALALPVDGYKTQVVRVTRGRGAGQERQITGNSTAVLTVDSAWVTEPDATSFFAIVENSWRAGNSGKASPLTVTVPERIGSGLEIAARAGNASGVLAAIELSPITRWVLGQSGDLAADFAPPPAPLFAIGAMDGALYLSGVAFTSLTNTASIVAGTYTFHYFDELNGVPVALSAPIAAGDTSVSFAVPVTPGSLVQIGQEIIEAGGTASGITAVTRALHLTTAAAHTVADPVYPLAEKVVIVPFVPHFFGTPASGQWSGVVTLPDVRLASAELYMTNSFGAGAVAAAPFTQFADAGLRILAGGQFSFQITGYLAVLNGAAPDIVVDSTRSIRDIYAVLREPSSGSGVTLELNRNGAPWATVQFDPGATTSYVVPGFGLPPLSAGDRLSLDVSGVGTTNPGSDLTVIVRL
ncbi:MAG TPA: phage tail protein [Bryobacteraceae bacterium]|nr:phage tail protein [Bryobacteraceae bacterium]